jgi:DNA-binding NarL/FixJ family response regulator
MAVRTEPSSPLTRRESEVARLAASGLTNRQIAKSLSLSVRTVECHLWTAYRKTETGTRTRLLLWLAANTPETQKRAGE